MKAVVMEGPKLPLEVRDMPVPEVGPRDVLIKVMACGVCRSDWHIWQGDWAWIGLKPPMPAILGHEQAGIVEQVGADVRLIKPGMRVLTPFHNGCGACRFCNSGDSNLCERAGRRTGGFAQYAVIGGADFNAIPLPDEVSFAAGAAMGCRFMTAYHGVADRGEVKGGDWVVVNGCGGIGLSAIQVAASLGAQVIAVDLDETKLVRAREQGAVATVDATAGDVPARVREITGGGADVSVDALGIKATLLNSVNSLRKGGIHVQIGLTSAAEAGEVSLPVDAMVFNEVQFRGSLGNPHHHYRPMLNMVVSGKLNPESIVSERIALADVPRVMESMGSFGTVGFTTIEDFS
ncbi:MAG: alcohol dehydrogenase catalytic domain-containing protein [Dehalococcoidia bacterium]|nr:alcohol dehydrogenase catalytic domain-containing protein [Dehalococcoidia bacterium]